MLALVLAALLQTPLAAPDTVGAEAPPPAAVPASAQPDAVPADDGIAVRPRVAPTALYSPNYGLGLGAGVGISNLGTAGTDLVLDVRLSQRYQSVSATFLSADPFTSRVHLILTGGGSRTSRRRYFGLGPNTVSDSEVYLNQDGAQADLRVGVYPLGSTGLYVQPGVRILYDHSSGVNASASRTGLERFDAPSRTAVEVATGEGRVGLSPGIEVATDLRDWPGYPRRGMLASAEARRFYALDDCELAFTRVSGSVVNYVPLRGRTTAILRALVALTRSDDADGDGAHDPIPFYYLPTLDDRLATPFRQDQLTGRDVLALGAGVRAPVFDFLGVYGIDALLIGYVGGAYDDVFSDFSPSVSFSSEAGVDADGRAALRPVLGLGLGLINLDKERVVLGGLIGVGPDGLTLATLRVAYDLRDARPLFR